MSKIWTFLMIISVISLIFIEPAKIITQMTEASMQVIELCVELLAIYTIWLGLLEIVDQSGLGNKLANFLSPIIKKLFKITDKETIKYISLNISANMLGLGNASTPMGIKAMQRLDTKSGKITAPMIMLLMINSFSIQFLPTTVIGLRTTAGSESPTDIIFPMIIATSITCVIAIFLTILCEKLFFRKLNKS